MHFLLVFVINYPVVISEVMSNVKGPETSCGDRNEFVEVYNLSTDTIDLADYFINDLDANPDEICCWTDSSLLTKYPGVRINSTLIYQYTYALILDREYTSTDTTGGNVQPYAIPDSTLILTTDDTSIGSGIQNTDPLILYSAVDPCTSSFGTPEDTLDGFPYDPGDGISWERINLTMPDTISNWHQSIDSSGCTPGRENSVVCVMETINTTLASNWISLNLIMINRIKLTINLTQPSNVKVNLFDVTGRLIRIIIDSELPAGMTNYENHFSLSNGIYFVEIKSAQMRQTNKILFIRE